MHINNHRSQNNNKALQYNLTLTTANIRSTVPPVTATVVATFATATDFTTAALAAGATCYNYYFYRCCGKVSCTISNTL